MEINWLLNLISFPFLFIPTLAILIDLFLQGFNSHRERNKLLAENLKLFEEVLDYEIGFPSDEDINDLMNRVKQKSNFLKPSHYEQLLMGYKQIKLLSKLLRRQKDNRDNNEVLRIKEELQLVVDELKNC